MTRTQFRLKLKPAVDKFLDRYRKDGKKAVKNSFRITLVHELMWRLDVDADDKADDVPFFDKVDPKWFLDEFLAIAAMWDDAARLLLGDDDGYTTYRDMMKEIEESWEASHGNKENEGTEAGR